jgi:hypothetical protein
VAGLDVGRYAALLDLQNPRFACLVTALTVGLVEPWWLASLVVFVHRKRSLATGEDLRVWFARLSKGDEVRGALLALALLLPGVLFAQDASEPAPGVSAYARALESVAVHLEAGRLDAAQREGRALAAFEYEWAGETLAADRALARDIAKAKTSEEARTVALRLRRLVASLDAVAGAPVRRAAKMSVDVASLVPSDTLKAGGAVQRVEMSQISVPERVARAILDAWDGFAAAVGEVWDWFWDWVDRIWPKAPRGQLADGSTSPLAIGFVVAVALVLVVLSIRALRRRRKAVPISAESGPVVSARDDDPLSRESNEWEIHAQQLGAAGRWREAIRAWYHAVLVALFRAGLVHFQKGRTNWEYASRLSPEAAFRPAFFDLTSLFDREWYGRRTSDAEAHRSCARGAREILESLRQAGGES